MIAGAIAVALPALAAFTCARRLAPAGQIRIEDLAAILAIAFGGASATWSALLFLHVTSRGVLLAADALLWILLIAALWLLPRRATSAEEPAARRNRNWIGVAVLVPVAAIAVISFASASAVAPHGEWDAWAQWNLRARFMFRGFPAEWRNAFDPVLAWSHPDYPLLVPASVARLWIAVGRETVLVPIFLTAGFAAMTVFVAAGSIARAHGWRRGCLAAAAILACPSFVRYAAAQCADIPLALYMLVAFIALGKAANRDAGAGRWWAVAGLSAALAAWTKNEGAAFFVVFTIAGAIVVVSGGGAQRLRSLVPLGLGAAPVLLVLVVFKQALAPPSYFVEEQTLGTAVANLFATARVQTVVSAMSRELWFNGATLVGVVPAACLFLATRGIRRPADAGARAAWPVMGVMALIYAVAYLVSPKDLVWQLTTSLDRLVVQLVPTLAWASMMMAR
jgi:hypothetical protein